MGLDLSDLPRYASNNDVGTAVLLAGMDEAGIPALVLASSMVVYGEGAYRCVEHGPVPAAPRRERDLAAGRYEPPCPRCGRPLEPAAVDEHAPLDPRSGYAATKVAQEHLAGVWARESGGRAALLRYHNVYGPGLPRDTPYAGVAAIFLSALLAGRAPEVYEDGGQRRDFVHVDDVAGANVAALRSVLTPAPLPRDHARDSQANCDIVHDHGRRVADHVEGPRGGEVRAYNVATGRPATVLDLATELAAAVAGPPPVVTGRYRAGDVRHVTASSARLRNELGWMAQVEFADGVAQLAREFKSPGGAQEMLQH
jgi:dTDP-L-rhamnose 4-epimerase